MSPPSLLTTTDERRKGALNNEAEEDWSVVNRTADTGTLLWKL